MSTPSFSGAVSTIDMTFFIDKHINIVPGQNLFVTSITLKVKVSGIIQHNKEHIQNMDFRLIP